MRSLSYVYAILDIDKYNKLFNYRYTQDIRYNHDKSKVLLKTYKVDQLKNHVIVVGYGRNGKQAVQKLITYRQDFVVIEIDEDIAEKKLNQNRFPKDLLSKNLK